MPFEYSVCPTCRRVVQGLRAHSHARWTEPASEVVEVLVACVPSVPPRRSRRLLLEWHRLPTGYLLAHAVVWSCRRGPGTLASRAAGRRRDGSPGLHGGLCGRAYRQMIEAAFCGLPVRLLFPFAGLSPGKALQATRRAILSASEVSPEAGHRPDGEGP